VVDSAVPTGPPQSLCDWFAEGTVTATIVEWNVTTSDAVPAPTFT